MTEDEINVFEKIYVQLDSLYLEIKEFSKKKPDDTINKFKLDLINKVLDESNSILSKVEKPFEDFSQFNNDDLPSYSDVIMIIGQYLNCLEKLKSDNVDSEIGEWFWLIDGKITSRKTTKPKYKEL